MPIGIDDNRATARPERVSELRRLWHGRRIVISLGRMNYYKGFDVPIDAAAQLPNDRVIVIGGGGELFDAYRAHVALAGLTDKVVLTGAPPDYDCRAILRPVTSSAYQARSAPRPMAQPAWSPW